MFFDQTGWEGNNYERWNELFADTGEKAVVKLLVDCILVVAEDYPEPIPVYLSNLVVQEKDDSCVIWGEIPGEQVDNVVAGVMVPTVTYYEIECRSPADGRYPMAARNISRRILSYLRRSRRLVVVLLDADEVQDHSQLSGGETARGYHSHLLQIGLGSPNAQ